jgi:SAM-dependent methyltransferase
MDRAAYAGMNAIEDRHWWFVARRRIIDTLIRREVKLPQSARVLEAGCGTGGNLSLLAGHGALDAFEYDADARALASAKNVCTVKPGALPDGVDAAGAPYDLIAILDVLEHIDDDVASLRRLGALLGDDGRILLTVPAMPFLWSSHDELHHHKRRYTRASLQAATKAAGLRVEHIGYFNALLFPLALAQRMLAKLTGSRQPIDALPSPTVNGVLRSIFASERHLVGRVRLPVGLSLFAVIRR